MSMLTKGSSPYNFALIDTEKTSLKLTVVNYSNGKILPSLTFMANAKFKNIKEFIQSLSSLFFNNSVKTVILQVFEFRTCEFPNNAEFCNYLRDFLKSIKIPYYFISSYDWVISTLFIQANITVNQNERVICIFTSEEYIRIASYKFTEKGYIKILDRRFLTNIQVLFSPEEFTAFYSPSKIVATSSDFYPEPIQVLQQMNLDNFIFVHPLSLLESNKTIIKISKWILNPNTNSQFYISPTCARKYMIATKTLDGKFSALISADLYMSLPFNKMIHVTKSPFEYSLCYKNAGTDNLIILSKILLPKNCHRNKVALTVDINNFPCFHITNILFGQISSLLKNINSCAKSKIPIIIFCDNFSVIFIYKNDLDEYDFVDGWGGVYGEELIISFYDDLEEPKFCQKAAENYRIKPSSVVFDLLKIMAMPPQNIKSDLYWGFKVSKSITNELFVEVTDKNGRFKLLKPSTLMALMLKEHLKIIKTEAETTEEANELTIWFIDDYSNIEKARIKNGFQNACQALKIKCYNTFFFKVEQK